MLNVEARPPPRGWCVLDHERLYVCSDVRPELSLFLMIDSHEVEDGKICNTRSDDLHILEIWHVVACSSPSSSTYVRMYIGSSYVGSQFLHCSLVRVRGSRIRII